MRSLVFILLLAACSSHITKPGKDVTIVNSLTPDQAAHFVDIGEVVVEQPWQHHNDEQAARDELRNYAARDGATLVLLEEERREPCQVDASKSCVVMRGRKFRAESGERPSTRL